MLTQISEFIAITTEPLVLLTLAIIISIFLYINKQKYQAILLASTAIFAAATIKILKAIIQAPRPASMLIQETNSSFPSGHTTFAIIFFGLLVYIFTKTNKQTIISSILATLAIITIILTRIQLQVHYPIDIIGGLIIGTTILTTSIFLHKKYA